MPHRIYNFALLVFSILLLFGLAGCATSAKIKNVADREPIPVAMDANTRPIMFKKIVIKLKRGTHVGAVQSGLACFPQRNLIWIRGSRAHFSGDELSEIFKEELTKANYKVVGDPNALFEDPSEWKAEYLIAGMVKDFKANVCYPLSGFMNWTDASGEAYMKVDWHIYSRLSRKVVCKVTTEGDYVQNQTLPDGGASVWLGAFAEASRHLLAEKTFHDLVCQARPAGGTTPKFAQLVIDIGAPKQVKLPGDMSDVRAGVVTVLAGGGHGSGFFISQSGYLLTNEHVVKEAKYVKVKLFNGRELLGEVIRKDNIRDVALIKTEGGGFAPLSVKSAQPGIGSEVFAVGSPLNEKFSTTVSKGIVSGYRDMDGRKYIQSDVNIQPGSSGGPLLNDAGQVVGISAMGITRMHASTGLNFFVPIGEAVKMLGVALK